jgi:hypothetical protein
LISTNVFLLKKGIPEPDLTGGESKKKMYVLIIKKK